MAVTDIGDLALAGGRRPFSAGGTGERSRTIGGSQSAAGRRARSACGLERTSLDP